MNLNEVTELADTSVFRFDSMPMRSYERDLDTQTEIRLEMNFDILEISRDSYKVVDFLSDIGGMQGMLMGGALLFLGFWNFNNFDNILVQKLFIVKKPSNS